MGRHMSHDGDQGGFLSRWSKRKAQVQEGGVATPSTAKADAGKAVAPSAAASAPVTAGPSSAATAATAATATGAGVAPSGLTQAAVPTPPAMEPAPRPTLQDVEQLDAQSDYRNFVARDVDPEVRNAAFKKLFHSDPHFNVMDGLDVYIDDYNTPNPLPVAIMKTLVQARAMGLIDDELKEQDLPAQGAARALAEPAAVEASNGDDSQAVESVQAEDVAGLDAAAPDVDPLRAQAPAEEGMTGAAAQPALVELVMVPDTASNDEPLRPQSTVATAEGTVVPFPRRPGSADPV
jgi:hypothetical protein